MVTKNCRATAALAIGAMLMAGAAVGEQPAFRRLVMADYLDKMKAGWVGQMCGVGWGGPTEFKAKGALLPPEKMPAWRPQLVNQFNQDDIYVEMTFLRTLEVRGWDCTIRQAGIDFANSGYRLWHANNAGRTNLRRGIAPPDSGHPRFNKHANDIDYQIESDYSGLIAPGMPQTVIELGEKFGRLMNYGDGLWAGQFVGACYAEAFFEKDPAKIARTALKAIPPRASTPRWCATCWPGTGPSRMTGRRPGGWWRIDTTRTPTIRTACAARRAARGHTASTPSSTAPTS
jgi:hypothetical protein